MMLQIPDHMHARLAAHIAARDYCILCEQHPSYGHDPECPLGGGSSSPLQGTGKSILDAAAEQSHKFRAILSPQEPDHDHEPA